MHFGTKSYLKSTRNYTAKHALSRGSDTASYINNFIKIFINKCMIKFKKRLDFAE
jgi:hypothetical protein